MKCRAQGHMLKAEGWTSNTHSVPHSFPQLQSLVTTQRVSCPQDVLPTPHSLSHHHSLPGPASVFPANCPAHTLHSWDALC